MIAPTGAKTLLSVYGRQDGMYEITYAMPDGTRQMVLEYEERPMAAGPTLIQKMWEEIDTQYEFYLEKKKILGEDPAKISFTQGYLRGCAKMLSIFMAPHFTTPDEIAKEAGKRYKAKLAGDTDYETPGVGSLRFTPPPGSRHTEGDVPLGSKKKAQPKQTNSKPEQIDDKLKTTLKMAVDSGMFTVDQLAKSYKLKKDTVEAAVKG